MPLTADIIHHNSLGTQEIRFIRDFLPGQRFRGPGAPLKWIYQYRNGRSQEWNSFYGFDADFEFLEPDFKVMSHFTSTSPEAPQSYTVLALRFLRGEVPVGEDGEKDYSVAKVVGKVMLVNGDLKRNVTGKTELIKRCETEPERVAALREYFGIELTENEALGIRGWVSELRRDK